MENSDFSVYTIDEKIGERPQHWSDGLTMYITKDGIRIKLVADEIKQLVKTLPRTFGGKY